MKSADESHTIRRQIFEQLPHDLEELAALWTALPDAVKSGFLATARALAKKS